MYSNLRRHPALLLTLGSAALAFGCRSSHQSGLAENQGFSSTKAKAHSPALAAVSDPPVATSTVLAAAVHAPGAVPGGMHDQEIGNRFAYIPPQCWIKTKGSQGETHNSCY